MRFLLSLCLLILLASIPAAAQNLGDLEKPGPIDGCYFTGDALLCVPPRLATARNCAKHTVTEERIKCLEDTIDKLAWEIPNLIREEVQRQLTPRLHRNAPKG